MTSPGDAAFRVVDRVVAGSGGAVPVRDYLPERVGDGVAPFLWIHGGAFVSGGLDQTESDAVGRALASRGRPVRTVAYRLVPRIPMRSRSMYRPHPNRFPAALDDVLAAWSDLSAAKGALLAPSIGGASAGAGLAAAAMVRMRDERLSMPSSGVLAYGTFHAALPPISHELRRRTGGLHAVMSYQPWMVRRMNINYVGSDAALDHRHAFAGGGDLTALPPVLLMDADRDTLRASSEQFGRELRVAGVLVHQTLIRNSRHGFLDRPRTDAFASGIDAIDSWLAARD